jgi:glycosyltransferase involved in cell wall biosynthesis
MNSKKIAFVVDTLANHGAERYLFELLKILKKSFNDITVVSIRLLNKDQKHYLEPILNLGVKFYAFDNNHLSNENDKSILSRVRTSYDYRVKGVHYVKSKIEQKKVNYLSKFDIVSIIKWEVYEQDINVFNGLKKINIHLLSGLDQYTNFPFGNIPKTKYNIIGMYDEQLNEYVNNRKIAEFNYYTIPLLIDSKLFEDKYSPSKEKFTIAVFSRIDIDQPTIFFLFLMHLLKKKGYEICFKFFGKNTDEKLLNLYKNTLKNLGIDDISTFMGHTFNIGEEIKNHHINLGVMNSIGSMVGYSSIEIMSFGLPVLFFDVSGKLNTIDHFTSLELMSKRIEEFIVNSEELENFRVDQQNRLERFDISSKESSILEIFKQL